MNKSNIHTILRVIKYLLSGNIARHLINNVGGDIAAGEEIYAEDLIIKNITIETSDDGFGPDPGFKFKLKVTIEFEVSENKIKQTKPFNIYTQEIFISNDVLDEYSRKGNGKN